MLSLCIKDQGSRIGNNSFNLKVENAKTQKIYFVIGRFVSYLAVQYAIVSLSKQLHTSTLCFLLKYKETELLTLNSIPRFNVNFQIGRKGVLSCNMYQKKAKKGFSLSAKF